MLDELWPARERYMGSIVIRASAGQRFSRLRHLSRTEGVKALAYSSTSTYAAQEKGAECPFLPTWESSSPNALILEVVA